MTGSWNSLFPCCDWFFFTSLAGSSTSDNKIIIYVVSCTIDEHHIGLVLNHARNVGAEFAEFSTA